MAQAKCPNCGGYRGLPRMLHDQDEPRECSNPFHKEAEVPLVIEEDNVTMTATVEIVPPKLGNPICPYCMTEGLRGRQTQLGPFFIMVVRCANEECRKILGIFPIGTVQAGMPTN
jgi:hypothetical protein